MSYLIVGGSSGLGRALAESLARAGLPLILVSSDRRDTQAVASDLGLRYGVPVLGVGLDLESPTASLHELDDAVARSSPLQGLLLPAGASREGDEPGQRDDEFEAITRVNYTSICRLVNHYLPRLRAAGSGWIVGFGSVAAIRGRRRNAAYSAAKRALRSYFESLRHALGGSGITVQFYVLGYLDTNLAFGRRTLLPSGSAARLAEAVVRQRGRDFGCRFYPRFWRAADLLIRALPWAIWRKLSG